MASRAYTFRIYPNVEQQVLSAETFGCVRLVYRHWLDRKIERYEDDKTTITYTSCAKELAEVKKKEEYLFFKRLIQTGGVTRLCCSQWTARTRTDCSLLCKRKRSSNSSA